MQKQYLGDTADTEKVGGTYADNEEVENKVSEDAVSVTDPAKVVNGSCQTEIHIITLIHIIITIYILHNSPFFTCFSSRSPKLSSWLADNLKFEHSGLSDTNNDIPDLL